MPVTRFAPSPTGRLHLGHAYSALLAHDFARERERHLPAPDRGYRSRPRRAPSMSTAIIEDLLWLGLEWDGEMRLPVRAARLYAAALERLKATGLVYPCFCTRADDRRRDRRQRRRRTDPEGAALSRHLPRPRRRERDLLRRAACLAARRRQGGRRAPGRSTGRDGDTEVQAEPERFGDVVLARKDAPASYHLAVTVDDAAQGVTDVVRGRDLFAATDVHRLLQALLDLPTPLYHHHALLADAEGGRLAKRHGAPTLADLRAAGADPARAGRRPARGPNCRLDIRSRRRRGPA